MQVTLLLGKTSWNAVIQNLAACSIVEPSLNKFNELQGHHDVIYINSHALLAILKACGRLNLLAHGQQAHAALVEHGHVLDCFSGSTLVYLYGNWGLLEDAQYVLDSVPRRNVILWTSLIGAYADHGHSVKALDCRKRMNAEGILPNHVSFICTLKACGDMRASDECLGTHNEIVTRGFEQDSFVGSVLVDAYSKCGGLSEAQNVVDALPCIDSATLTPLLLTYAEHGLLEESFNCWKTIIRDKIYLDAVTLKCSLKACASTQFLEWGRNIHIEIIKRGLEINLQIVNAMVDMYAKCGSLTEAEVLFCSLPTKDVVSYNTLMHAYAEHALGLELRKCFERMRLAGLLPTAVTFVCCLNACEDIEVGHEIHLEVSKLGLEGNKYAASSLVGMYAKFGLFAEALKVFSCPSDRSTLLWTTLVSGYADHNFAEEAMHMFGKMISEGVLADAVTFICALRVCGEKGALDRVQELHAFITSESCERDPHIGSMLVEMYTSCGLLQDAEEVIHKLLVPSAASWTALSVGYAKNGFIVEAVDCLKKMQVECWPMNAVTYACSLRLCGNAGALNHGLWLHTKLVREGSDSDFLVRKALMDFYGKCGLLFESQNVFNRLLWTDSISWTVMITGHAWCQGENLQFFSLFHRMEKQGVEPDHVTVLSILTACSHFGLIHEGQAYVAYICKRYGITPVMDHMNCMVDGYSRAGQFNSVMVILYLMPFQPDLSTFHTVLSACRKVGDIELGIRTFESALMLEENPHVALLLLLGICAETDF